MTEYITREQAEKLAFGFRGVVPSYRGVKKKDVYPLCNAAIQAYRENLTAGVVLPEPAHVETLLVHTRDAHKVEWYSADQIKQVARDVLEQAARIAWQACNHEGDDYGNGYNKAAVEIERAIRTMIGEIK